jgi:hypothetical protein
MKKFDVYDVGGVIVVPALCTIAISGGSVSGQNLFFYTAMSLFQSCWEYRQPKPVCDLNQN